MASLLEPVNQEAPRSSKTPRMEEKASSSVEIVDVESFCFTPISHRGTNRSNAISVDQYSDDRDLPAAIMASMGKTKAIPETIICLSDGDDDDEIRVLKFKPEKTPFGKRRKLSTSTENGASSSSFEPGESSNCPPFVCEICTETKTAKESFAVSGCSHVYCTECVVMYIESKLQDNIVNIRCPESGCIGLLEAHDCRPILPPEVFDRWGNALCEAVILGSEKFYCPYKDCSALLIDDGREAIKESECPNCKRWFCASCKVPWHAGLECEQFQSLNKDERGSEDIMLMQLAQSNRWRRCPMCRFYVEKSSGCMYMKCRHSLLYTPEELPVLVRCGIAFCYNCGTIARNNNHMCYNCRR